MSTEKPFEPNPADFGIVADKSVETGIADASAAYDKAIAKPDDDTASESEAHPS